MASDGTNETISPEKTLNCDIENFHSVTEEQFEGDALAEQDREPGGSYSFSGETESDKDNNQSAGMSFQILSNFILWFSFYHLWNRRIESLTPSLVGIFVVNDFSGLKYEIKKVCRLVWLSEVKLICASPSDKHMKERVCIKIFARVPSASRLSSAVLHVILCSLFCLIWGSRNRKW